MVDTMRPVLLLLVHAWGGGTIHYARLLRQHVSRHVKVVFAWGVDDRTFHVSTRDPEQADSSFDLAHGLDGPVAALRALGVSRVDLLCTIGLQAHVDALLDRLGVPFDVTFLSYELLTDNPHLMDADGRFIGENAVSTLAAAQDRVPPFASLLRRADRRIACSRDLAKRAGQFLPDLPILPARLPERPRPERVVPIHRPLLTGEPLRVLALGRLAAHKGLATLREVVRLADAKHLSIEFVSLGEIQVEPSDIPVSPRLRVLGRYKPEALGTLVPRLRPHLAWFPFSVPETHSFVLSEAMSLRLPVLATGIGAIPERVEGRPATWLVPVEQATPDGFLRWFEALIASRLATPAQWMATDHLPPLVASFYEHDYLTPLVHARTAPAGRLQLVLDSVRNRCRRIRQRLDPTSVPDEPLQKDQAIKANVGTPAPRPKAPDPSVWDEHANHRRPQLVEPVLDVIVPVYRGYDDTLACLHSVLTGMNATAYELVVVNDASPEPALVAALEAIAARGLIRLETNPANQGFVRSVNTGMALHPDRDVVLLNADTLVHGDWIDRLRAHRLRSSQIGTITPWSNNATLLSYPQSFTNNDRDIEIDNAALDRLAGSALGGVTCDIPTGVGFCIHISRPCIDDIGLFDAEAFGRGYGEENDFCLRATARGWRNIAACDVFVRHTGEVSFQADAVAARRAASTALLKRHPGYDALIGSFMRADPLRVHRQALDLARLDRWGDGKLMLVFTGRPDQGLSIDEVAASVEAEGFGVIIVHPGHDAATHLVLRPVAEIALPNLPHLENGDLTGAAAILGRLRVARAEIHSLHGYTPAQARFARDLCGTIG